jgi:hypothetical protein
MELKHRETLPYGLENNPFIPDFVKCLKTLHENLVDKTLKNSLEETLGLFYLQNMLSCFYIKEELISDLNKIDTNKPSYFVVNLDGKAKDFVLKANSAKKGILQMIRIFFEKGEKSKPKDLFKKIALLTEKKGLVEFSEHLEEASVLIEDIAKYRNLIEHDNDKIIINNITYDPFVHPQWNLFGEMSSIKEDMEKIILFLINIHINIFDFGINYYKGENSEQHPIYEN